MTQTFDPFYNQQMPKGDNGQVINVLIETSEALTLTQAKYKSADGMRVFQVPESGDLSVYGDVVRIVGTIKVPGKNITIHARYLETHADADGHQPTISVAELPGADPDPPLVKLTKPPPGADATNSYRPIISDKYTPPGSGQSATNHPKMNGIPGNGGHSGDPAGSITIVCGEFAPDSDFILSARGGKGGTGQKGQDGQNGGDGGKGSDAWQGGFSDVMEATNGAAGGNGGNGGKGGPGGQGGQGGSISFLSKQGDETLVKFDVSGGDGGAPGGGGAVGNRGSGGDGGRGTTFTPPHSNYPETLKPGAGGPPGQDGAFLGDGDKAPASTNGTAVINLSSDYSELAKDARVSQLQMTYERLRLLYFVADPTDRDSQHEVASLIGWLSGVLRNIQPAAEDKAIATALAMTVRGLGLNLRMMRDFYGHDLNWVPLASMDEYDKVLGDLTGGSLSLLNKTEQVWNNYRKDINKTEETKGHLNKALKAARQRQNSLADNINTARDGLVALVVDISARDLRVQKTKKVLNDAIEQFKLDINITPGLSMTKLLDVMESLAFLPEEAGFQRYSMISSQAGNLWEATAGDVPTDDGDAVKKSYVIQRMDVMKRGVNDLDEGYKLRQAYIVSNDPDGYKLIYQQEKFNDLLDNFYKSQKSAREAEKAMNEYVREVQTRNRKIIDYNGLLSKYYDLQGQHELVAQQIAKVQAGLAETTGNEPVHQLFVDALYRRNLEETIRELYMAGRAYTFWSLKEYDVFRDVLSSGGSAQIDFLTLMTCKQAILTSYVQDIEALVGDLETRRDPVVVEFNWDSHPEKISTLQQDHMVEFDIKAAKNTTFKEDNSFAGFANVRLVEVRCWAYGLKTQNQKHIIHLTHLGNEEIVTKLLEFQE